MMADFLKLGRLIAYVLSLVPLPKQHGGANGIGNAAMKRESPFLGTLPDILHRDNSAT